MTTLDNLEATVRELCDMADLPSGEVGRFSNFLYLRALGMQRQVQSNRTEWDKRQLLRFEKRMEERLEPREEVLLVECCVRFQRLKRDREREKEILKQSAEEVET